jgi:hypothetical protein
MQLEPAHNGLRTSAIKQALSCRRSEMRNSTPDAKAATVYPNDSTMPLIAVRTDSSSSTIEITGVLLNQILPDLIPEYRRRAQRSITDVD